MVSSIDNRTNLNATTAALLAAVPLAAGVAVAQEAAPEVESSIAEVVVTGTSIRGVEAPVGSPITVVGREEIEDTGALTTQDILKTIPTISNSQAVAQGILVGSSYFAPTIRSLGSSASNSTLVLIDGHRIPLGNHIHPLPDPSIIPPIALERVEVVPDGASATYGSDAVAGVINFITRDSYDGFLTTAQFGMGDDYDTQAFGVLWGTNWDSGSVLFAYSYGHQSELPRAARDYLSRDHRSQGGTNFRNYACSPATIQPAGSSARYLSATSTTPLTEAPCEETVSDHISDQRRHNVLLKLNRVISDVADASLDLVYSHRENHAAVSRGTIEATVFQTGDQANPFYTNPPGVTATSQTIRFLADDLLGPGAYNLNTGEVYYISGDLNFHFSDRFGLSLFGMAGATKTIDLTDGTICGSCATLALNRTTNSSGNMTTPSVPGTDIVVIGPELTPQNALDVWNPPETNRTSPEVLRQLVTNRVTQRQDQTIQQARAIFDASLFDLPGGSVRSALGVEFVRYTVEPQTVRPNNTGPYTGGARIFETRMDRDVKSAFAELLVPIVGAGNEKRFVNSLDLNLSVRHDEYAVFGGTTNPKIGFNWEVTNGFRVRGAASESFVAPGLASFGDVNGLATYSGYGSFGGNFQVPLAVYPEARLLPGCETAVDYCTIGGGTAATGISLNTGNRGLVPQTGESWSLGVDFAPSSLPVRGSLTWFNNKFRGGITSPNVGMAVNTPSLNDRLRIYPNGATPEEIAAEVGYVPQTGNLPTRVYFVYHSTQANVVNLDIAGLDVAVDYLLDTGIGTFTIGGSATYFDKFDQFFGDGEVFSVLNTQGFNQTFSSVRVQGRGKLRWERQNLSATLYANFTSSHRNWSSTTRIPVGLNESGNPDGTGGDRVGSNLTFDLHLSLKGLLGGGDLYLDATNIFDREPPFYNSPDGYGPYHASPIGRVLSVGIRYPF